MYTIAVDAMGGDNAPWSVIEGAVMALRASAGQFSILLVGDSDKINDELAKKSHKSLSPSHRR